MKTNILLAALLAVATMSAGTTHGKASLKQIGTPKTGNHCALCDPSDPGIECWGCNWR